MKELKEYEEPEMEIKYIDWSDILTNSPEAQTRFQGVDAKSWDNDDPNWDAE